MSLLLAVGLIALSETGAACETEPATAVAAALSHSIELSRQFKASLSAGDDDAHRALRRQLETFDEQTALPCVRRAARLLARGPDRTLTRKLLAFALAHQNSADETTSAALASVFTSRTDDLTRELRHLPAPHRRILVRQIQGGLQRSGTPPPPPAVRQRLDDRLTRLLVLANPSAERGRSACSTIGA